jgi:hypothetical protein
MFDPNGSVRRVTRFMLLLCWAFGGSRAYLVNSRYRWSEPYFLGTFSGVEVFGILSGKSVRSRIALSNCRKLARSESGSDPPCQVGCVSLANETLLPRPSHGWRPFKWRCWRPILALSIFQRLGSLHQCASSRALRFNIFTRQRSTFQQVALIVAISQLPTSFPAHRIEPFRSLFPGGVRFVRWLGLSE